MGGIALADITAIVLAGGQGTRMGGADKGLQDFGGTPLALNAANRLQAQTGAVAINANRNLDTYRSFGFPVWADSMGGFPGPLAGFMAGLENCATPWLLTVACDAPLFPGDLAARLAAAVSNEGVQLAMAADSRDDGSAQLQPVFCLLHKNLLASLREFTSQGKSRVREWTEQQRMTVVRFDAPTDDPRAFANANTLAELQALERLP